MHNREFLHFLKGLALSCLLFLVFCPATAFGATIQLPQTGQISSYATGDDGNLKAGVAWPYPRFTQGTGAEVECMIDNLTGLMWPKNGDLNERTWQDALTYVSNMNSSGTPLCGHNDWRLPNVNEFESLNNAQQQSTTTWLAQEYGFTNIVYNWYWTSTTQPNDPTGAMLATLGSGRFEGFAKTFRYSTYAFPVRGTTSGPAPVWRTGQATSYSPGDDGDLQAGVAWPEPRFEITGTNNACVFDNLTGLMWVRQPGMGFSSSWQGALTYANDLILCGFDDWRMPNRKELWSLAHYGVTDTAAYLVGQGFVDLLPEAYWSSTTQSGTQDAWINHFDYGWVAAFDKTSQNQGHSWAVRAGGFPDMVVSPGAIDFKGVVINQASAIQTITITNTGTADLIISSLEITGTSPIMFDAGQGVTNGCVLPNATVMPGGYCTLDVTFTPTALGPLDALLYINSNYPTATLLQISLTGEGVIALATPSEGTIGTEITINGSGFGDKKGKVLIGGVAAKVTGWIDARITCTVKKVPLPVGTAYPVAITSKDIGTITLDDAFTVKNPELDPLTEANRGGIPEEEIVLTGRFFGTKKGKVYIEYTDSKGQTKKKTCKVTYWNMIPATGESELRFIVPKISKTFTVGPHPLKVDNKIRIVTASEDFIVGLP
jgi:hypothetical protein